MIRHRFVPVVLAAVTMLGGCAHLEARLAVLDPRVAEREQSRLYLRAVLPEILALDPGAMQGWVDELDAQHAAIYGQIKRQYETAAADATDPQRKALLTSLAGDLLTEYQQGIGTQYKRLAEELVASNARVRAGCAGAPPAASCAAPEVTTAEVRRFVAIRQQVLDILPRDTAAIRGHFVAARPGAAISPQATAQADAVSATIAARPRRSLLSGREAVSNSEFLHAISNASEAEWNATSNRVSVRGTFGNIDAAVKVDPESGDFTLKGLSFDPRDVARAAGRVGTQAILLAAQAAGVPTPLSSPGTTPQGTSGAALAASNATLRAAEEATAKAKADSVDADAALRTLASALVDRYRELGDDAARNRGTLALAKATFGALKGRITATALPAAPVALSPPATPNPEED